MKKRMLITDFDGTLLTSEKDITSSDLNYLKKLGQKDIIRVIATGRSLFSLRKVIGENFPVDYIIFSSGAGIYDWNKKRILFSTHLDSSQVKKSISVLTEHKIDFFIQSEIPDNHKFDYYLFEEEEPDAWRRIELYDKHAKKINNLANYSYKMSSHVIGISSSDNNIHSIIKSELPDLNVIRTTSPLDNKSMWIEIFSKNISKSKTCEKLCKKLNIPISRTIGIGNDYNDRDLLEWTEKSYVVENAPTELKNKFNITASNDENGFSKVAQSYLNKKNVN